eukprot:6188911-Pleurochrysis_carterae.AAC.3
MAAHNKSQCSMVSRVASDTSCVLALVQTESTVVHRCVLLGVTRHWREQLIMARVTDGGPSCVYAPLA